MSHHVKSYKCFLCKLSLVYALSFLANFDIVIVHILMPDGLTGSFAKRYSFLRNSSVYRPAKNSSSQETSWMSLRSTRF